MLKRVLLVLLVTGVLLPHTLWINATSNYVRIGEATVIFLGWGHNFPVADFIDKDKIEKYGVVLPSGRVVPLKAEGRFFESVIKFQENGFYHVFALTKSGFYTMSLVNGRIIHYQKPMNLVSGKVLLSNCYQEFARGIIKVGEGKYQGFARPLGLNMEVIPLDDPSSLKQGDFLRVKVLLKGKPLPFVPVYATYEGFSTGDDYAFATKTDSRGIARIRVLHWGRWMIKAHLKKSAEGDLAGKCKMVSVVSTLTMEVK